MVAPFAPAELLLVNRTGYHAADQFLKRYLKDHSVDVLRAGILARVHTNPTLRNFIELLPWAICDICCRLAETNYVHRFFWLYVTPSSLMPGNQVEIYISTDKNTPTKYVNSEWAGESVRQLCARCAHQTGFIGIARAPRAFC